MSRVPLEAPTSVPVPPPPDTHESNVHRDPVFMRRRILFPCDDTRGNFGVMVENDEDHTFDQVIVQLIQAVHCTPDTARQLAMQIDREGRAIVLAGTRGECTQAVAILSAIDLSVSLVDLAVVARQHAAEELLEFLHFLCTISSGVRRIVCAALVAAPTRELLVHLDTSRLRQPVAVVDYMFVFFGRLWKQPQHKVRKLIFAGLLVEPEYRLTLAVKFLHVSACWPVRCGSRQIDRSEIFSCRRLPRATRSETV